MGESCQSEAIPQINTKGVTLMDRRMMMMMGAVTSSAYAGMDGRRVFWQWVMRRLVKA
jgi:hypothetical protein